MEKTILCLVILYIALLQGYAQAPSSAAKTPKIPNQQVNGQQAVFLNTIDPAVAEITFNTIKQGTNNILRVTGKVKNLGGKDFNSGRTQQQIHLYEVTSPSQKRLVGQTNFSSLRSNQVIEVTYERPALKPADEFPPSYEVIIVYDPDIFSDANPNNDDANMKNNAKSRNPRS